MVSTESPPEDRVILASSSAIRAELLSRAGLEFRIIPGRVDEFEIRKSLLAEAAKPRDIADALAEFKARKISQRYPPSLVIGSDQVLEFDGELLEKPQSPDDLVLQLTRLSGHQHCLHSAAVLYESGKPVWRVTTSAKLHMARLSQPFIRDYVAQFWDDIRFCVGGYRIEAEGVRLFERIEGDYFTIMGIPLLEVLAYLRQSGQLRT